MKKLLAIVLVAVSLTACGNNDEAANSSDTTTVVTQDTMQVVTDTTISTDTINKN